MPENSDDAPPPNPILAAAMKLFEAIVPGGLSDPEKAMRELLPALRYLVIARVASPTVHQLEVMRRFSEFDNCNLLQIRKALQSSDVRIGPFPGELAQRSFVPVLQGVGLSVSLHELTPEEQARMTG